MSRYSEEFQTKEQALDDARVSAAITHQRNGELSQLRTALAAATKRAEEAEAKLAQSTNYVADDDTYPTCVWFANGRVVSVNAAGVLEIRFGKQLEACDE